MTSTNLLKFIGVIYLLYYGAKGYMSKQLVV